MVGLWWDYCRLASSPWGLGSPPAQTITRPSLSQSGFPTGPVWELTSTMLCVCVCVVREACAFIWLLAAGEAAGEAVSRGQAGLGGARWEFQALGTVSSDVSGRDPRDALGPAPVECSGRRWSRAEGQVLD